MAIHTVALVIVVDRTASRPQDDRIWIWITRSHPVGEVELSRIKSSSQITSSNDLVDSNAHKRMMLAGRPIIQVLRP